MSEKRYLVDGDPVTAWELIEKARTYKYDDEVEWMRRESTWFTSTCAAVLRRNGHSVNEMPT